MKKLWNSPEISTQGGERANPQASSNLTCSFYLLIQTACACYFTQQEWNEKYELICIHLLPLARGGKPQMHAWLRKKYWITVILKANIRVNCLIHIIYIHMCIYIFMIETRN